MLMAKCDECGKIDTRLKILEVIQHIGYENGVLLESIHALDLCEDCLGIASMQEALK